VVSVITDLIPIIFFTFARYWTKMEYNRKVHKLFIDLSAYYDSVKREDLYNILLELIQLRS
jgi:hypothetical protein